jgi:hypothetical protein
MHEKELACLGVSKSVWLLQGFFVQ